MQDPGMPRRRKKAFGWAMLVGVLLLLVSSSFTTAVSEIGQESRHDFEVVIREAGSLGAALSGHLAVNSFYRDPRSGDPSRLQSRGVELGDVLVAVNSVPVEGMSPKDVGTLLQAQSRPLRLVFRPHDMRPRIIPGMYAPEAPKSEDDIKAEGHLDVLDGPISLLSLPVTRAKFGGVAACDRKLIVASDPPDACTDLKTKVTGYYVMVDRGNCSFAIKALNLGSFGALGMILVNSEPGRSRMSGEDVASRVGQDFEAPVSVMISKADGDKLKHALRVHRNHLYGRLVVTEECFRGEDEWHKVHDVAWKDHPHLQQAKQEAPRLPPRPVVSAKGIRFAPPAAAAAQGRGVVVDLGGGATLQANARQSSGASAATARSKPAAKKVVVEEWDRSQGGLGRLAAEWRVHTERANEERRKQKIRSGVLQLRSTNVTYIWEKGLWSDQDEASVAGVASGPVVARAEFLPADFGGPISLGKRAIGAAVPIHDCSQLEPPLPEKAIWVISMATTTCSLSKVIKLAQKAQTSLLVITGTGYQSPRPRVLRKEDMDSETQAVIESSLWIPVVEVGEDEGRHLLDHVRDHSAMVQAEVVDSPEVLELWAILDKLQDPGGWPNDKAQQRRLFQHLQQRHDPGRSGGSVGRYKYLVQGYEKVEGAGPGGGGGRGYAGAARVEV